MRRAAALCLAAVLIAGCSSEKGTPAFPAKLPSGAAVIRGWTKAIYLGDYEAAANYFAKRAIIQQGRSFTLKTHDEAVFFGQTLPCRAQVLTIEKEPKGTLLATFRLIPGFSGSCAEGGEAQVRFFIRHGKIETWRQLPEKPTPPQQSS